MDITLVILAAGMASRYGSMKQTEGFGPAGESIMDYSIYDAMRAGFSRVVFIIRRDFAENFQASCAEKFRGKIKIDFVYQELDSFLGERQVPAGRVKPWGTGHALLCASENVSEPFAVINADDFYGRDAFEKAAAFLRNECNAGTYAIIGYPLGSTLSEFGTVSRGVCEVDADHNLVSIQERTKIYRNEEGVVYEEEGAVYPLSEKTGVSMNFWCFHPSIFAEIKSLFSDFLNDRGEDLKSEFFIPIIADDFISRREGKIKVIPTSSKWFGVTYKEDAPAVRASLETLTEKSVYPPVLWS